MREISSTSTHVVYNYPFSSELGHIYGSLFRVKVSCCTITLSHQKMGLAIIWIGCHVFTYSVCRRSELICRARWDIGICLEKCIDDKIKILLLFLNNIVSLFKTQISISQITFKLLQENIAIFDTCRYMIDDEMPDPQTMFLFIE